MTCPRAKKAKKSKHKLKRAGSPGFDVAVNGVFEDGYDNDGWMFDYDPPAYALALETKRYLGHWCPGSNYRWHERHGVRPNDLVDTVGLGGVFVPAHPGLLIECALGCGFKAAE